MSQWLPIHVRRFVAVLLLLLDLGLEPGSALSFAGMSDPDEGEAVADLCRQDDFWWGKTSAAIDEATRLVQNRADCRDGNRDGRATQVASVGSAAQAAYMHPGIDSVPRPPNIPFEVAPPALDPASDERSPHRNSYIAQKQDIVLIV
jgi:hypothetical protein